MTAITDDSPEEIAQRYGCPIEVARAMARGITPLLAAVRRIGPERCQWIGQPLRCSSPSGRPAGRPVGPISTDGREATSWSLDGKRATVAEIMEVGR